jgi:hypothetical protein
MLWLFLSPLDGVDRWTCGGDKVENGYFNDFNPIMIIH